MEHRSSNRMERSRRENRKRKPDNVIEFNRTEEIRESALQVTSLSGRAK